MPPNDPTDLLATMDLTGATTRRPELPEPEAPPRPAKPAPENPSITAARLAREAAERAEARADRTARALEDLAAAQGGQLQLQARQWELMQAIHNAEAEAGAAPQPQGTPAERLAGMLAELDVPPGPQRDGLVAELRAVLTAYKAAPE